MEAFGFQPDVGIGYLVSIVDLIFRPIRDRPRSANTPKTDSPGVSTMYASGMRYLVSGATSAGNASVTSESETSGESEVNPLTAVTL